MTKSDDLTSVDNEFGRRVRLAREARSMSQSQLADAMHPLGFDVTQQMIYKIESGQRKVTVGEATALADALGLRSVLDLTRGESSLRLRLMLGLLEVARKNYRDAGDRLIDAHLDLARQVSEQLDSLDLSEDEWELLSIELRTSALEVAGEVHRAAVYRLESTDFDFDFNPVVRDEILKGWKDELDAWDRLSNGHEEQDAGNG